MFLSPRVPVVAVRHLHAPTFEKAAQRKYIPRVVVDEQHLAADEIVIGSV